MESGASSITTAKNAPAGLTCTHCQEECPDNQIQSDHHLFCCEGCKMAWQILNTHEMCAYYTLDANPGKSLRNRRDSKAWSYLDDEEVKGRLLDFDSLEKSQVSFYLPQMHCVSCVWLLENLYKLDKGVLSSRVQFLKKMVVIQFDPGATSLRRIASLLASIGYAPEINLGDVSGKKPPLIDRRLAYQIGIAGFAFGNIMLFSFPEYLGMTQADESGFAEIFGWLSILIAIPVLLYSAKDYLTASWHALRNRHLTIDIPIALGILMLFGRSTYEIISHTGAGYMDSFAGLIFLLLIGKWFQQKTWQQLSFERDYKSYFPVAATLKTGDEEKSVPVERLVPGDIILIKHGEIVPADGILLHGDAQIDYSFVTGESVPVPVESGGKIFAGGKQSAGQLEISITKRVDQSDLTRLWNNDTFKAVEKSHVSILADKAGRYFTTLILGVGILAFGYWFFQGNLRAAINAFTSVMIVACPCAVALAIPFTLGNILRILGRNKFYLKNTSVIETFSQITDVVFDKTGTLTTVAGNQFDFEGTALTGGDKIAVRSLVKNSGHPLSRQLYQALHTIPVQAVQAFQEMQGQGIQGLIDGKKVRIGSGIFCNGEESEGVHISIDGVYKGRYRVTSQYRPGLAEVLSGFGDQQDTWLVSGDQSGAVQALESFFPGADHLRFGQKPQDKLEFVQNLQEKGKKVLMIGDGLNDAGALRQSELGIVITEDTNNFTPACDAILHASAFNKLPQMVQLARTGVKIVNRAYIIALVYNLVGLSYAVTGTLSPLIAAILMPLSSVTIVLFGIVSGNFAAMKLLSREKDGNLREN